MSYTDEEPKKLTCNITYFEDKCTEKQKLNNKSFIDSLFKRLINLLNWELTSTKTETIYQVKPKPFLKKSYQKCGYISKKIS